MITFREAVTPKDIAICLAIRRVVFIDGQNVPEPDELDGKDGACRHYLLNKDGTDVGAARILPVGSAAKIQRVAVLKEARSAGLGSILMQELLAAIRAQPGFETAVLGAQTQALGFYERLGFSAFGPVYDDAGIPHRDMSITL